MKKMTSASILIDLKRNLPISEVLEKYEVKTENELEKTMNRFFPKNKTRKHIQTFKSNEKKAKARNIEKISDSVNAVEEIETSFSVDVNPLDIQENESTDTNSEYQDSNDSIVPASNTLSELEQELLQILDDIDLLETKQQYLLDEQSESLSAISQYKHMLIEMSNRIKTLNCEIIEKIDYLNCLNRNMIQTEADLDFLYTLYDEVSSEIEKSKTIVTISKDGFIQISNEDLLVSDEEIDFFFKKFRKLPPSDKDLTLSDLIIASTLQAYQKKFEENNIPYEFSFEGGMEEKFNRFL